MGEVAAGVPGSQVRQPDGRLSMAWEKWGAIRRMLNRKLSMAWEKWQFEAAEMKYQATILRRGLMRMIYGQMAKALTAWRQHAQELKESAHLAGGAIRRMLNRKLSMAWEKWEFEAAEMAIGTAASPADWCGEPHQQRLLAGAVHRLNAQAEDVDGMGEVAAGVPGSQVRQPDGRWCDSAHVEQETVDGMGEVAVHCC
eukprot:TRINITY_DN13486_c0_g1_i17.p1 TRINITY_DN13486_c0_g1~~TRINITY_DN13486_c0_g1_i17.p1  ORF type:complete len:198 (-),score=21.57 TRINITY_DN13486_c0_g1_i17:94-687(-)